MKTGKAIAALLFALGAAGTSVADNGAYVHPTLPLYARDAADTCVANRLQIRVTLTNVYAQGIVKLDLYGGEKNFLDKKGKLRKIRVPAEAAPQTVCIDVPRPGDYAIASYHDLDADRKLKKKWNFKPKEPYALSNNPVIEELRMPKWSEAAFRVGERGADIELVYYGKKAGEVDDDDTDFAEADD